MPVKNRALIYAILSTCFSSIGVIYHEIAAKSLPIPTAIAVANTVGGFSLLCIILLRREKIDWAALFTHKFDFFMVLLCRFVIGTVLVWYSLSLTLGVKAMFFSKIEPYFILMWQWIFDRATVPLGHIFLLLVHFAGAAILSGGDFSEFGSTQLGDLILILAMSIFALSYRFAARLTNNISSISLAALTQLISGLLFFPLALYQTSIWEWPKFGAGWNALFVTIVLWSMLGLPFWFLALKGLPTWLVSALRALGPVVAAPIAIFFFHQHLSSFQWIGAGIVIATSILLARMKR